MRVENTLKSDANELAVDLKFNSFSDFDPVNIVNQVPPLRKLLEMREKLRNLLTAIDGSDDLEQSLERVLKSVGETPMWSEQFGWQPTDELAGEPSRADEMIQVLIDEALKDTFYDI